MAWALPAGAVLGVLGDRPGSEQVKTPLATKFESAFAAEAHEAMLFDTLDAWDEGRNLASGGRRVLVFAPPDAGPWFDERVPTAFALQPQVEGDLGARMRAFFAGEFEDGATRVVLIGAASPTLDPSFLVGAFLCLERNDVVLGPSTRGGTYLIGLRPPVPPIFEAIDWGTSGVLGQLIDHLAGTGHSLAVLPPWYDVETPADWQTLTGHVRAMRRAGLDPGLPRVEALLERSKLA